MLKNVVCTVNWKNAMGVRGRQSGSPSYNGYDTISRLAQSTVVLGGRLSCSCRRGQAAVPRSLAYSAGSPCLARLPTSRLPLAPRAMGCTSSAPASIPPSPHAHATVTEIEDTPDKKLNATESNGNKISVSTENIETMELPSCDKLVENQVEIATVASEDESSSIVETSVVIDDVIEGVDSKDEIPKTDDKIDQSLEDEDRLSRLEEVVEKVVELYINEGATPNTEESIQDKSIETHIANVEPEDAATVQDDVEKENEVSEECASPTQSASSRATRWEALADIAAELPPSVTVDPLTGHIYALSK